MKRITINTLDFAESKSYLWTWDKSALNPSRLGFSKNPDGTYDMRSFVMEELQMVKPDKSQFQGLLIVLTSKSNSSASTNFISRIKKSPGSHYDRRRNRRKFRRGNRRCYILYDITRK